MKESWNVKEVLEWTGEYLKEGGVERARLEAETLLAHALKVDRLQLYLNPERPLEEEELDRYRPLIKKRREGTPLQYVTGKVNFMGFPLKVDKRALIPRPETEELTEEILDAHRGKEGLKVLDLGTGTGAIVIALAKFLVGGELSAVDIDEETLQLATENAEMNDVREEISFILSDWFEEVEGEFDLIVSNPPYVSASELEELDPQITDHEPRRALDGGEGGLEEIDRILKAAPPYLNPEGRLYLEIGAQQGEEVEEIVGGIAELEQAKLLQDTGGQDRIIAVDRKT